MVTGKAAQDLGMKMNQEQEVLMLIADMIIETYAAESALLRAEKTAMSKGTEAANVQIQAAQVYLYGAVEKVGAAGREAIMAFAKEAELPGLMAGLKRFTRPLSINTVKLRREIASRILS